MRIYMGTNSCGEHIYKDVEFLSPEFNAGFVPMCEKLFGGKTEKNSSLPQE